MRPLLFALFLLVPPLVMAADEAVAPAPGKAAAAAALQPAAAAQRPRLAPDELKRFYADEKNRITTDWVDDHTRQMLYDAFSRAGYIQVLAEAAINEDGVVVYRKAFKSLKDAHPDAVEMLQWCKTDLSKERFEAEDQKRRQEGYMLMQTHSLLDAAGVEHISASWLRYAPDPE
jgi:hypothetical protein